MNNNLNNLENNSKIQIKNQKPLSSFNKQNININNNSSFNSNIFDKKYASNISNEKGNLETVQHNFNVNNKQPNIGISCATQNQKFGNYKYTNTYQNINNNVNNNKDESFSITKNFSFSNMGK